ncbi:uncharacterized protein PFL1_04807 [Pseudozyma flocculosa PF-1]|uniref:Related to COX15 - cytochrome oxidase assembly factor n=2 Tax=Pseudozyma flocculosa TaxID=84751 RepID=A0A5C3F431_9BASI|nr:uncharacterized protein PFL1_04807 [Pseudozyma flocculosa PF-1]EPQ27669.1 hypothetical protein PFL1_04807 [Pseudozyma flocculosa PF-1]SPO39198.1 related to COX15 - cytochrome oxidase assembly factor [Pseudozyma flocculosa]
MSTSLSRSLGLQLSSRALARSSTCHGPFTRSFAGLCARPSRPTAAIDAGVKARTASPSLLRSYTSSTTITTGGPLMVSTRSSLTRNSTLLKAFADARRSQSTSATATLASSAAAATSASSASAASSSTAGSTPLVSRPVVAVHLYALAFLVYAIIVVGGLTRLTESGLSITEWNPGFKGMRLPMTTAEWEAEWDKYKQTPEFLLLNQRMSLDDFKSIYLWEWGHRILGRVIGVAFVLPAGYFIARKWVGRETRLKLVAIALGIGFQGFLGWFMVKSGLSNPTTSGTQKTVTVPVPAIKDDHPNSTANTHDGRVRYDATVTVPSSSAQSATVSPAEWTPRVSHFRLAMHMGTAFLVYLAMLHTGLSVTRDYKLAKAKGVVAGVPLQGGGGAGGAASKAVLERLANTLNHPLIRRHSRLTKFVTALVFTTAMSGALVAGLDAGLVYNEFPTMGEGRIAPPVDELFDDRFAQNDDGSDKVWRNLSQNPVTVQLIHRTLAITTALTVYALAWKTRKVARQYKDVVAATEARSGVDSAAAIGRVARPPPASGASAAASAAAPSASAPVGGGAILDRFPRTPLLLAYASAGVVTLQATLGITTLIYMVPIPLASAHQAGSVALLSVLIGMIASMRRVPARALQAASQLAAGNQATKLQHQRILQKVLR